MIVFLIPVILFIVISVFLIICIAWTHRPISVWQMVKEELLKAAERKNR